MSESRIIELGKKLKKQLQAQLAGEELSIVNASIEVAKALLNADAEDYAAREFERNTPVAFRGKATVPEVELTSSCATR